eukprot:SAG31_NODE_14766_length_788_cov_1.820029_1_plen_179_part_01
MFTSSLIAKWETSRASENEFAELQSHHRLTSETESRTSRQRPDVISHDAAAQPNALNTAAKQTILKLQNALTTLPSTENGATTNIINSTTKLNGSPVSAPVANATASRGATHIPALANAYVAAFIAPPRPLPNMSVVGDDYETEGEVLDDGTTFLANKQPPTRWWIRLIPALTLLFVTL